MEVQEHDKREALTINGSTVYDVGQVTVEGVTYDRLAIKTHFIQAGEDYKGIVRQYLVPVFQPGDWVVSSEKVVAMCQNDIIPKSEIKVGRLARFLSKFASSSQHGIAMNEPLKLQIAIDLAGPIRVLFASFCSAVTKLFGKKGVFYKIVGHGVDGIDGVYQNSPFEFYRENAVLNPKNPDKLCEEIYSELNVPMAIVDASDLSVDLLGKCKALPHDEAYIRAVIRDNPAGQGDELTPLIIIRAVTQEAGAPVQADQAPVEKSDTEEAPVTESSLETEAYVEASAPDSSSEEA